MWRKPMIFISERQRHDEHMLRMSPESFLAALSTATEGALKIRHCARGRAGRWYSGVRRLEDHVLWFFDRSGVEGTANGEPVVIPTGSFHWLAPGVQHELRKFDDGRQLQNWLCRFSLHVGGRVAAPQWSRACLKDSAAGRLLMERLVRVANQAGRFRFEAMRALLVALLCEVENSSREEEEKPHTGRRFTVLEMARMEQAALGKEGHRFLAVEMAREMQLSGPYFARKFRATFEMSPREWVTKRRLAHATTLLLETGLRVGEVAAESGYEDPRYFARQFRAHYGVTPTAYREEAGRWK